MATKPDAKKIWKALENDAAFMSEIPEQAVPVIRELAAALPGLLADHLGKTVTLSSLMEAKLAILEHMLDQGFIKKMLEATPAEQLPFPLEEMLEMATEAHTQMRMPMMEMIHNLPAFLAQAGTDERLVMRHGVKLNAENLRAYDKKSLTIGRLLETQPAIFIRDDRDA